MAAGLTSREYEERLTAGLAPPDPTPPTEEALGSRPRGVDRDVFGNFCTCGHRLRDHAPKGARLCQQCPPSLYSGCRGFKEQE